LSGPAVSPGAAPPAVAPPPAAAADHEPSSARAHTAAALVPAGLALVLFVLCGHLGAGSALTRWLPGTLFLLGLLGVAVVARRRAALPGRRTLAALAFLAAFTAWSFLSIAWADVQDEAWNGANRTLLYLVVFALFAVLPWTLWSARIAAAAYAFGIAAVAAGALWKIADTADPELFVAGRLAYPTGYANANAALFLTALWAALAVAPRRDVAPLLRAGLLGAATLLAGTALLSQSRGALFAVPATALVAILVVPGRVRLAVALALPVGAVALGWDTLLDVFPAAEDSARLEAAFSPALRWILVSTAVATVLGLAWALVDRRVELAPRTAMWLGRGAAIGAIATLVVGTAAVDRSIDLRERARNGWDQFTSITELEQGRTSNFGGLGTNRWDFWRVGLDRFADRPVQGVGADNFAADYLRDRRSSEEPLYPHSLEVRVLMQLGVVGAALLAGALVAAAAAALLAPRRRDRELRALAAGAFVVFAYWLVHGSADWFWEIPGLGAPAFAFLGVAAALGERRPIEAEAAERSAASAVRRRALPLAVAAAGAVAAAAACVSLVLPWLAARDVERALETWRVDPAGAYARLDSARRLNALSDRPDLFAGAIASRRGELARMRLSFERALERNPGNWYAELELALVETRDNRWTEARRRLRRALRLNPLDPVVRDVLERVERRERVPFAEVDRLFELRAVSRVT
jgi:hypothetical protein